MRKVDDGEEKKKEKEKRKKRRVAQSGCRKDEESKLLKEKRKKCKKIREKYSRVPNKRGGRLIFFWKKIDPPEAYLDPPAY